MPHRQTSILPPQTSVPSPYEISRMYLVVLVVVVLSSISKCDTSPGDDYTVSPETDVTTWTTIYPSYWSVVHKKFSQTTQIIPDSTRESLTSGSNHDNGMKSLSTPSTSPMISTNVDSPSQEYPKIEVTTNVDDRITTSKPKTTMSGGSYDINSQTTISSTPETTANACDTDQLEVTSNAVHINASTNETYCSLLVNALNSTDILVSVSNSDLNNVYTYFYIEILESQIYDNSKRINLISLGSTPCAAIIHGSQFRFHFRNTEMIVGICTKEVETSARYETVHPLIEATQCRITSYENKIQENYTIDFSLVFYTYMYWFVTLYQAKCTCLCPDTCKCTLAYREWLSVCTNSQGSNTTRADLIVYEPTRKHVSFAKTGLHQIQHNAFLGLQELGVLILSHNSLLNLQPTLCQNLPKLKILMLDNNKLANLTSDSFTGPCAQQLDVLNLQFNELTHLPHDLFNSTSKLKNLDLRQNRLAQLSIDLFSSLEVLLRLWLGNNAISILPVGVFKSLGKLVILDLSGNSISTLPVGVFHSLNNLRTLDLSGNSISVLPAGVFKSLGRLWYLYLSGNNISTLQEGVFESLVGLKTLDLSGNNISTLPVDVFHSLGNWQTLETLDLSGNNISTLPEGVFDSLSEMRKTLDLSGNDISTLPDSVFKSLGRLQKLDLSNNDISTLPRGVFKSLGHLDNERPHGIFLSINANIGNLRILNLSGNDISTLPADVFKSLQPLHTLDLSGNNISTLPVHVFHSLDNLWTLDLSGNAISALPMGVLHSLRSLRTLDLSDNKLILLPDDAFRLVGSKKEKGIDSGLKIINLRGNNISLLHAHVFDHLTELITLDLSHNSLSHTLPVDVFNSLQRLKTLDLSNNRIEILPRTVLDSQRQLLTLDLSNNELCLLPSELFFMLGKLISVNICCNNLTINASQTFESLTQLKILDMSKNNIEHLPPYLFESTSNLLSLEISENKLGTIPNTLFRNLSRLIYLNMSKNSLSRLPSFIAQRQLQVLDVSENQLNTLKQVTFGNLKKLKLLSIAKNYITSLHSHMFLNVDNLEFINASYNAIHNIGFRAVSVETRLKALDLRGNEMYKVTPHSFANLKNSTIIVDKYATCCLSNKEKCISMKPRPQYLTCKRMLRDIVLRISVWVLGLSAFICNIIAYCVRSRKRQANKVQTLLISHLALSDLLMGVNMLILAIADVYYGQYFPSYAHVWRQGFVCKFAGFLSILSSEGSVFFITLISIDRMLGIKYPFGGKYRLGTKSARIFVALAWLMAFLISVIPINLASDKGNFYSISEVCIGIPIVRRHLTTFMKVSTEIETTTISSSPEYKEMIASSYVVMTYTYVRNFSVIPQELARNITYTIAENAGSQVGSIYSIVVFICINFSCFVIVPCCYVYIFIKANSTADGASRPQDPNEELRMARKMFAIVFTDFCCWVPLSFVCILTQSGVIEVSPEMYAWTVGFILPINSSINPFLYVLYETISEHLKKKREDRKAREEIEMQVRWKPIKSFGLRFEEN